MNMEMQTGGTGLCDYTLVVDDNKFRQSCLQSKQFSVPEDKLSHEAHLKVSWTAHGGAGLINLNIRAHFLPFISCNTHLNIFSWALSIHQLSHSPTNAAGTAFWVEVISGCADPFLSSHLSRRDNSHLSRLRDESRGDAGVSLKKE